MSFKVTKWGISDVVWVLILRILVVFILGRLVLPLIPVVSQQLLNVLDRVILICLTLIFALRWGSLKDLGLKWQPLGKNIAFGLIGGVALFVLATGAQHIFVSFLAADITTNPLVSMAANAKTPLQLAAPLFVAGVMAPIAEEIYYRGFALPAFIKRWGVVIGVIVSGLFFSAVHLSVIWFAEIALVGMGLAFLYYWTGSLIPGIIAHSFVNSARLILVYLS
jgi:hypothetical protein